jgi:sarcosine oxidase
MASSPGRALVVGAGVFGAATALELRLRGWSVTLVDPGPLPHEAASSTDVSKVIRMDYGSDPFYLELAERSLEGWDRWNRDWPRPLYHESGFLILARGGMRPGGFEYESRLLLADRGHETARLSAPLLRERWPAWSPDAYSDGYFNPRGGWAESAAVVSRLLEIGLAAGVRHEAMAVARVVSEGSTVCGVEAENGERLSADRVVVAAGAWTPSLLPGLGAVLRSTGQPVLHFQVDRPEDFSGTRFPAWAADIANSGWYGFPSLPDGRVKIGHHGPGSAAHPDQRGAVGEAHERRTRDFLREAIPSLADAPIACRRVCMYCDSFDGDLFIGRDPDREGLIVAAGGSGHGFKFAPVLGGLIADVSEGEDPPWASRLGWRDPGPEDAEEARFTGA